MNYKIGAKVKFLNDIGGGIIRRFQDDKVALVENEDGFEIPVLISELISDERTSTAKDQFDQPTSYQAGFYPAKDAEEEPEDEFYFNASKQITDKAKDKVYLSFVMPEANTAFPQRRDIFLINDSPYHLYYSINHLVNNKAKLLRAGMLEDNTKILIDTIDLNMTDQDFTIQVQCIFFHAGYSPLNEPVNMNITAEKFDFFNPEHYSKTDFFQQKAFSVILTGDFLEYLNQLPEEAFDYARLEKEKNENKTKQTKTDRKPDLEEIDLHIEEILDNHQNLNAGEILNIQLDRFTTALDGALKTNLKRIVFIHGVGNGKLKYELRKKLDRKYPKMEYHDASFKEYGYGATMIILRRK